MPSGLLSSLTQTFPDLLRAFVLPHLSLDQLVTLRTTCRCWKDLLDNGESTIWQDAAPKWMHPNARPPSGVDAVAAQAGFRRQAALNDRVQQGNPSAFYSIAKAGSMRILRCTKAGRLVLRLSESSRFSPGPVDHHSAGEDLDESIRAVQIEDGKPVEHKFPLQEDDTLLHPADGMSLVIVRQTEPLAPGGDSSAGPSCAPSDLSLIRVDLATPNTPSQARHDSGVSMADMYTDGEGKYLALRQQPDAAHTSFRVMRLHDLRDESVLSMRTQLVKPHASLVWKVAWTPGSTLVAIWCEAEAPTEQPTPPCPSHMLIFEASNGQVILDIPLQRPMQQLGTGEPAKYAWSPDARQFAFWGQPSHMDISWPCLVVADAASGHLLTWVDSQQEAACIGLQWATSSQWLLVTMKKPRIVPQNQRKYKVAIDASNCRQLHKYRFDVLDVVPSLMAGDCLTDPSAQSLVCMHVGSCDDSGATAIMSGRPHMGCRFQSDLPPEFAEGVVALSPDGSLLICVMCVLVHDGLPLQRECWEDCPPDLKRLELYHYEPFRGAGFGCYVMDLLEFPERGTHEEYWSLDAEGIAWKPCCPPGRQIYAVFTAKWDLVLVAAYDQHEPLKTWSLEELVRMGLNDCFKAADEPAVSLSWSADGSYLFCQTHTEDLSNWQDTSSCVIIAFC